MDIKQTILFLRKMRQRKYYYFRPKSKFYSLQVFFSFAERASTLYKSSDGSFFIKNVEYTHGEESNVYFLSLSESCLYIQNQALADFVDKEVDKIKSWDWEIISNKKGDKPVNYKLYPYFSRFILWRFLIRISVAHKYSLCRYSSEKVCVVKNRDGKWGLNNGISESFKTKKEAYLYIYKKELSQFIDYHRARIDSEKLKFKIQDITVSNPIISETEMMNDEFVFNEFLGCRKYRDQETEFAVWSFLSKTEQNQFFLLNEAIVETDEVNGFSYDIKTNLYRTVYYDRGKYIWGKYFISYSDMTFYMCMQAYTVFKEKQRLLIEQWKKELEEEKTWFDLHLRESWKKKPDGYRPLSEWRLIHFLGNVKYGYNEYVLGGSYQNSPFRYTGNRHTSWWTNIDEKSKRFHILQSAWKYIFKKEYKPKMRDYIQKFGSKRSAWLHIYETEYNKFVMFYQRYFQEESKRFTDSYFDEHVTNPELRTQMWNPNIALVEKKQNQLYYHPDFRATRIERYGNLYGSYVTEYGTPFAELSLPPAYQSAEYHVLELLTEIPTKSYTLAPAFRQPGGATLYQLPEPISELMRKGVLKLIR